MHIKDEMGVDLKKLNDLSSYLPQKEFALSSTIPQQNDFDEHE
jgi:hypothetical protein